MIIIFKKWWFKNLNLTPLHIVCKNNGYEIAELIISNGANVNAIDSLFQEKKFDFK